MKLVRAFLAPRLSAWDMVGVVAASAIIENGYGVALGALSIFTTALTGAYLWDRVK